MNSKLILLIATVATVFATSASAEKVSYYAATCGWEGPASSRIYACRCTPGDSINYSGSTCTHVQALTAGRVSRNAKRVRSVLKMKAPPQR